MLHRHRLASAGLLAAAAGLFSAVPAQAQSIPTSPTCASTANAQVFAPWGDPSEYFLAPDGNFASGGPLWSLSGGAGVVAGGDGQSLAGAAPSTQSLSLPDASSATSPAFCVSAEDPTLRFFAENTGSASSQLQVSATVHTDSGASLTVPVATLSATSSWNPTSILPILDNALAAPDGTAQVTLSFTPQGQDGNWQIDDLYIDPWTRGE